MREVRKENGSTTIIGKDGKVVTNRGVGADRVPTSTPVAPGVGRTDEVAGPDPVEVAHLRYREAFSQPDGEPGAHLIEVGSQEELGQALDEAASSGEPCTIAVRGQGFGEPLVIRTKVPDNIQVHLYGSTKLEVHDQGFVHAHENTTVFARGSSTVLATDRATVEAGDGAEVEAADNVRVTARDASVIRAGGAVRVVAEDLATVEAWETSKVRAKGKTTITAHDMADITAHDETFVTASDASLVQAYNNTKTTLFGTATALASDEAHVTAYEKTRVHARHFATVNAGGDSLVYAKDRVKVEGTGNAEIELLDKASAVVWDRVRIKAMAASEVTVNTPQAKVTAMDEATIVSLEDYREKFTVAEGVTFKIPENQWPGTVDEADPPF